MCKILTSLGIEVEVHHHEVANAGQCEIGTKFNSLVHKADELQTMKYVIKNVAYRNGKTATFMRSEEHTSELQSLMRTSYAVFCLKKKTSHHNSIKIKNYIIIHLI